ncbi:MAG: sulfite exporter TauE/SafE family protein [Chloroflexi bacterium]|nr:sulfite exporter TauE/SafE family protein [Chloroflexota bacterium]
MTPSIAMPFGMPLAHLALAGLVVLAAAYTHGLTGQGFAQVAAPLLLLFLEPRLVVPLNLTLASVVCASVIMDAYGGVRFRRLVLMAIASVIGAPLGAYVLLAVSPSVLKLIIATAVVVFTIPMLLGLSYPLPRERTASLGIGFLAGMLASSTSASGPPVVLFLVNQGWPKEALRPSFSAFFLFSNLVALGAIVASGGLMPTMWPLAAALLPVTVAGFLLGTRTLPWVNAALFRRLSLLVVLIAGVAAIGSVLGQII